MLFIAMAAIALSLRVPVAAVVAALVLAYLPIQFTLAVVLTVASLAVIRHRRSAANSVTTEADLLRDLSGRVSAGAPIRSAIADAAVEGVSARAARIAALGRPMAEVGQALSGELPINGAAFRGVCSFSEQSGAAISAALSILAERADEATEFARQRRVALAQVKLSAVVVGVVPLAASLLFLLLKGVPEPGGAAIVVPMLMGATLQLVGTAIVFRVASGAL